MILTDSVINENQIIKISHQNWKCYYKPSFQLLDWSYTEDSRLGVQLSRQKSPLGGSVAGVFSHLLSDSDITEINSASQKQLHGEKYAQPSIVASVSNISHLTVWKECKGPHLFHSLGPELPSLTSVPHCCLLIVDGAKHNHKRNSFGTRTEPSNHNKTSAVLTLIQIHRCMWSTCFNSTNFTSTSHWTPPAVQESTERAVDQHFQRHLSGPSHMFANISGWKQGQYSRKNRTRKKTRLRGELTEKGHADVGLTLQKYAHYACWTKTEYFNTS